MRAQPAHELTPIAVDVMDRIATKAAPAKAQPDETEPAETDRMRTDAIASLRQSAPVSASVISSSARCAEGVLLALTGTAAVAIRFAEWPVPSVYVPLLLAAGVLLPLLAHASSLYRMQALLRPLSHLTRLWALWTVVIASLAVVVFLSKTGESYSRIWLASWYLLGLPVILAFRMGMAQLVRHWNRNGQLSRNAVLVGGGPAAAELLSAFGNSDASDINVVGIFDDRDDTRSPPTVGAMPKLGNVSELIEFVRQARIDLLLVTLPLTAEDRLLQILKRLWVLPVDIRLSAYTQKFHYRPRAYSYIGNVPFLDVFDKPLSDWGSIIKSIEDKTVALLALTLLSPLMLLVAIAVKLDSKGPVLFKQNRFGFNNELIGVYKFRSMYHDMRDVDASKLVTKDDPRVTRVGRFIRRTSMDELPQLFNVLKGELSLVGPRPHPTKAKAADQLYNDVVDGYFARHKVKPGITGWAQVNGWRGETDTAEKLQRRVEHDLYYIENWSLALDLYILWRTPTALLGGENAY